MDLEGSAVVNVSDCDVFHNSSAGSTRGSATAGQKGNGGAHQSHHGQTRPGRRTASSVSYPAPGPLSRSGLVDKVRQYLHQGGVDPTHYSGHSFRIGAATTAAAEGVSDATIQVLGRWASDSYTCYIRLPRQELSSFSKTLADQ